MKFSYVNPNTPDNYTCTKCNVHGVKLWRQYQTFLNHIELLCAACAVIDQEKDFIIEDDGKHEDKYGERSDCIGWLVPAVPDEDNVTFWGYTSVPEAGCLWWDSLPVRRSLNATR